MTTKVSLLFRRSKKGSSASEYSELVEDQRRFNGAELASEPVILTSTGRLEHRAANQLMLSLRMMQIRI